jgi:hypothetical protein
VVREIHELSPDVEGGLDRVWSDLLEGDWVAVKAEDDRFKSIRCPMDLIPLARCIRVVRPERIVDFSLPWPQIHRGFIGER